MEFDVRYNTAKGRLEFGFIDRDKHVLACSYVTDAQLEGVSPGDAAGAVLAAVAHMAQSILAKEKALEPTPEPGTLGEYIKGAQHV